MRTQKDFDTWFSYHNGDPWNYSSLSVQNRLDKSMSFMKRYISANFSGDIIEFGAFNGDFTLRLCHTYPNATIIANDISEIAINQAKEKIKGFNVNFITGDMFNINLESVRNNNKHKVILLLESLYYMTIAEREVFLLHLKNQFPLSPVFFSCPIIGGKYYTEQELLNVFSKAGYNCAGKEILNLRHVFLSWRLKWLTIFFGNFVSLIRKKYSNQVIYHFISHIDK